MTSGDFQVISRVLASAAEHLGKQLVEKSQVASSSETLRRWTLNFRILKIDTELQNFRVHCSQRRTIWIWDNFREIATFEEEKKTFLSGRKCVNQPVGKLDAEWLKRRGSP